MRLLPEVIPACVAVDLIVANMSSNWQPQVPIEEIKAGPIEGGPDGLKGSENGSHGGPRKKIVIVGLGMVGISFM